MDAVPPPFTVDVRPERARVLVCPHGELDIATVDELAGHLTALREVGWSDVVLDLRGLSFLDSTGLRLLLTNQQESERDGWSFSIVDGEQFIARVLELSGLSPLLARAQPRP